ncbi:MAG TPA: glycosyltransferase [Bryobacteraceae bacterium]|nr:glycosyltransferase [Bryobacteraceae bacterium]
MAAAFRKGGFDACPINWLPCFPDAPAEGCAKQARPWDGQVRLAYFGRLEQHKGLDALLEALASAGDAAGFSLDIWGSGREERNLNALRVQLGIAQSVQLRGAYPGGVEGARMMCTYDAIALPSTGCEGLPLILLEAMAYGIPFLATDVGAIRDCCQDNPDAILAQPRLDAIAGGLRELARRFESGELCPDRLRDYYRRRFSYEVMAERWRECLRAPQAFFAQAP